MDAARAGGGRHARGVVSSAANGRGGVENLVSGSPDVALPLPPSSDAGCGRMRARARRGDVISDDLTPPDPVHRHISR